MLKLNIKLTSEEDIFVDVYISSKIIPEHLIINYWNASAYYRRNTVKFYLIEQSLNKSKILFKVGNSDSKYYFMLDNNKFEIKRVGNS